MHVTPKFPLSQVHNPTVQTHMEIHYQVESCAASGLFLLSDSMKTRTHANQTCKTQHTGALLHARVITLCVVTKTTGHAAANDAGAKRVHR